MEHHLPQDAGRTPAIDDPTGAPARPRARGRTRAGAGALAAAVLVLGLSGCGTLAGAQSAASDDASSGAASSSAALATSPAGASDTADTAVGEAAGTALPSVVTISVTSGRSAGSGSGSILDTDGHILTNTHVVTLGGSVSDPDISVRTSDGRVYAANVVGTDPISDLAVIKIDATDLTPIQIGSSKDLKVGDDAIAIGAPLGLPNTVTDGIISTLDRTISVASAKAPSETGASQSQGGSERFRFQLPDGQAPAAATQDDVYINVIQTDAAINPGNSGGALVDAQGRLVGVNVAIASAGSTSGEAGNIGVGFAIPVDYAKRIADDLIADGSASHGMLGVSVSAQPADVQGGDEDTATVFSSGARVEQVVDGSAAAEVGIRTGDVITAVDGRAVTDTESLTAAVREHRAGEKAAVTYRRDGQDRTADVTLTAMEATK